MITPDIAMADLKQAMAKMDRAMKASAKKAGDEFEDELEKGIVAGAKRGIRRAGKALQGVGAGAGTAAKGAAGGLFGALMMGVTTNIQRADEGTALIQETMGASTARTLMGAADLTQMDAGSMSKLWNMAQKAGFDDVKDFTDILTNITLKVKEAETGEDTTLNQFKGLRGAQLFEEVLGSIAKADPATQAYFLDKLEAGERLSEMAGFNRQVMDMGGGAAGWMALSDADAQAGLDLLAGEKKLQQFTEAQVMADNQRQQALMAAITPEKVAAYISDQHRISSEQLNILNTYEQNLAAALPLREAGNAIMTTIAENTGKLVEQGSKAAQMLADGQPGRILELSPTFGPKAKAGG